jgi:hypothetical protein
LATVTCTVTNDNGCNAFCNVLLHDCQQKDSY